MATELTKKIKRVTTKTYHEAKNKRVVVGLEPSADGRSSELLTFRVAGTRTTYSLPIEKALKSAMWDYAHAVASQNEKDRKIKRAVRRGLL
jgi:hypothetical protein